MKFKMPTAYAASTLALVIVTSATIHTLNRLTLIEQAADASSNNVIIVANIGPKTQPFDPRNLQLDIARPKILTMHLTHYALADLQTALTATTILTKIKDEGLNREAEIICLARNIYQEARGEESEDQYAVGFVTRNRVNRSRGENYCEIVYQILKVPHIVEKAAAALGEDPPTMSPQFSWVGHGFEVHEKAAWIRAQEIAYDIYTHPDMADITHGATNYYDQMLVTPAWAKHAKILLKTKHHTYVALRWMPSRRSYYTSANKVIPPLQPLADRVAVLY